jgi:hypothetical protein
MQLLRSTALLFLPLAAAALEDKASAVEPPSSSSTEGSPSTHRQLRRANTAKLYNVAPPAARQTVPVADQARRLQQEEDQELWNRLLPESLKSSMDAFKTDDDPWF